MNKLYYGDNLDVLRKYIKDESVDLCYIDPPFNSKRNYNQIYNNVGKEDTAQAQAFVDTWTWDEAAEQGFKQILSNERGLFTSQSIDLILGFEKVLGKGTLLSYLISITLRIAEIYRVLKPTGSFYFHCDPTASHYIKIVIDAIFCADRKGEYLNEITWKRTSAHSDGRRFGANADIIFFYAKTEDYIFNQMSQPYSEEYLKRFRNVDPDGRRWQDDNLTAKGLAGGGYTYEYKGITSYWRCPLPTMEKLDAENRLHFTSKGGIRLKRYLDESVGMSAQSIWNDIPPINSQAKERLRYPTQKPEGLLDRIIETSSNPGDTVLDAYCGCGTTVAVAERLERKWIGIDITYQSISLILKRLEDTFGNKVLENIELNGVPKDFKSAVALANKKDDKTRKEFEKWFVLAYSNNRAIINEKKGGDEGIDGIAYVLDVEKSGKQERSKVLFSVKSNKNLTPAVIRDLNGTMERDGAVAGYLLTLYPMDNLVKESKKYGTYRNNLYGRDFPKVQVVSVEEIIDGARLDLPTVLGVLKSAAKKGRRSVQHGLEL
jgi:DNA modification methylase